MPNTPGPDDSPERRATEELTIPQPDCAQVAKDFGAQLKKHLAVFREFDLSGDGLICHDELFTALKRRTGVELTKREIRKLVADVNAVNESEISFPEFCVLIKTVHSSKTKNKAGVGRNVKAYLTPEQVQQYSAIFGRHAGDNGQLDVHELGEFLAKYKIQIAGDRLRAILTEVDDDGSGQLDETEFMTLLIKSMAMKKRKVGPGQCSVAELQREGWSLTDLKKEKYEIQELQEAGYTVSDLMEVFSLSEMKRGGLGLKVLIEAGWDCLKARDSGFEVSELIAAGVPLQRIRMAGWNDGAAAVQLRRLNVDAGRLKTAGWSLTELRTAGYSTADLRVAGFSAQAISALQKLLSRHRGIQPPARRDTFDFRKEADERNPPVAAVQRPPPAGDVSPTAGAS